MPKTTVINGNGGTVEVDEASVPYLTELGNKRLEPEQRASRSYEASVEEKYNDFGSTLLAGVEGAIEGATFGLATPLFDDEATRLRARENPIAHGVGEFAGVV